MSKKILLPRSMRESVDWFPDSGYNIRGSKMGNTGTQIGLLPDARVPRAVAVLRPLDAFETSKVIVARLGGAVAEEGGLPACQRDEERTAIFVDVVKSTDDSAITRKIRLGCMTAMEKLGRESAPDPGILGDLCYLAAAIGAVECLGLLVEIIKRPDADQLRLADGEQILTRALRSLTGLLAVAPRRSPDLRYLLERLVAQPRYEMLALTALVGLWPEERAEFVTNTQIPEDRLNLALVYAGFDLTGSPVHTPSAG